MHAKSALGQSKILDGFFEIGARAPAVRINADHGRSIETHLRGFDEPTGDAALKGPDLDYLAARRRHRRQVRQQSAFAFGAPAGDCLQLSQPLHANPPRQCFRLTLEIVVRIESPRDRTRGADRKSRDVLRDAPAPIVC
jgi:hypothetical protein